MVTTWKYSAYDAGDTLAYDPEERLVSDTSGSTILLANVYDGAGMRAVKTASDGTVYFLDDASGQPVVEETYTGSPTPTTTLSHINAFGADGLRQRYTVTGGGSETFYLYDPQGSVVSRIVSGDPSVQYDGEPFTDLCVWDGYGQERSDNWAVGPGAVDRQYTADDQVGFEGQAGYYQDWELAKSSNPAQYVYLTTTPSLLTRRYYDASTGRFVNRDPIGYGAGTNLYAYCGGNPVNETDPEGMRPETAAEKVAIAKLLAVGKALAAPGTTKDTGLSAAIATQVPLIEKAISDVPTGKPDPVKLDAALWAIEHEGDADYGYFKSVTVSPVSTIAFGKPKCNIFVAAAYALGGGVGFGGKGVPLSSVSHFFFTNHFPPTANQYDDPKKPIPNFTTSTTGPEIGDIVAFGSASGGGHATISLGGNLLIYAGRFNVKMGTISYVYSDGHSGFPITTRVYNP